MYYIYVLRCNDHSLYTGITTDIAKRLHEHYYQASTAAKYTRSRRVVSLELLWQTTSRSLALKREHSFKALPKNKKEAIIKEPLLIADEAYTLIKHKPLQAYLKRKLHIHDE